jgi:hypothetical protein
VSWFRLERLRLVLPAVRLAWQYLDDGDDWRSLPLDLPMAMYGEGNLAQDFRCYLEGPSRVEPRSLRGICAWLRRCKYQSDSRLFGRPDYWQYPAGFEELRRGDCEDHALWAWRKLIELGYEAELMVGRQGPADPARQGPDEAGDGWHAWVVYCENGGRFLLEATTKSPPEMIRPLHEATAQYTPHASVDHRLQRHLYAGYIGWLQTSRERRSATTEE